MPSDIAKQIVQQVFGDDKAAAVDSINDALGASTSVSYTHLTLPTKRIV